MGVLNTATTDSLARFESSLGDPQHVGFALTRRWERINATSADGLMTSLNGVLTYSSPKADNQAYSGTFIQSKLTPEVRPDDSVDLVQTLVKVKSATDSADADLVEAIGDPKTAGFDVTRAWHYINPTSVDSLMVTLNAIKSYDSGVLANGENYAGKFIISKVRAVERDDRSYDILQECKKVVSVDSIGDLNNPLIDREKDIIHPFGEGTGVGRGIVYRYLNLDPASDTKCMVFSDTELVGRMTQNDSFIHVARKTTTEDDGTMVFWVMAQRKQRIAWSDTIYQNPDHVEDNNPGRDNTIRTKTWYGIDNDCYTGVLKALNDTCRADTSFSIMSIKVRDNDDGSDDWSQIIVRQFNDTRTDSRIINTHGVEHNALQIKTSRYDNYAVVPPMPTIASGYKFEEVRIKMNDNGLFSVDHVQSKPTPSNATANDSELTSVRSPNHTDVDSAAKLYDYTYDQVPLSYVGTAMSTLQNAPKKYVITDLDYSDIGNGAAKIVRRLKKVNSDSYFISDVTADNNGGRQAISRTWPYVSDTVAASLMDGEASESFSYGDDSYLHIRASRTKHFDGTSTVTQYGEMKSSVTTVGDGKGGGVVISIGEGTDSILAYNFISEDGRPTVTITYFKICDNFNSAAQFAEGSTDLITQEGRKKTGGVILVGPSTWKATKVVRQ